MCSEFEIFTGAREEMKRFDIESHVWIEEGVLGLSRHAIEKMEGIAYVQVDGGEYQRGEVFGTVESVKACEDLKSPCHMRVGESNPMIVRAPEVLNERDEWICRVEVMGDDEGMMSEEEYMKSLEE